ncbi:MAG: hypothetical protein K5876_06520 [Ruminiclostridium sp.]|nr:hypothetical protein [Ruminiclostridium sp.]
MAEMNEATIKKDRLRFTKNKLSANLIIFSIVANALYFVDIYRSNVGNYYYKLLIGISVVYNLVFMLAAFLASEGVKNYKLGYCFVAIVLGALQIGRIFWLPTEALNAPNPVVGADTATVMTGEQFTFVTACLVISAVLLIIAGITGIIKTTTLNSYRAELEKKENRS